MKLLDFVLIKIRIPWGLHMSKTRTRSFECIYMDLSMKFKAQLLIQFIYIYVFELEVSNIYWYEPEVHSFSWILILYMNLKFITYLCLCEPELVGNPILKLVVLSTYWIHINIGLSWNLIVFNLFNLFLIYTTLLFLFYLCWFIS